MSANGGCAEVRALAPELALGIAGGDERARALEHLAGCPDCRRYLEELAETADELLLLAPTEEPPVGFESRVLERLPAKPRVRRRFRPLAAVGAAAAAAAALAAGAVLLAVQPDRELADSYRETLADANGEYFTAAELSTEDGTLAGHVFGYEGSPSWVFATVSSPKRAGASVYRLELRTRDGRAIPLRTLRFEGATGSVGNALPVSLDEVASVRLRAVGGGETLSATFESASAAGEGD